MVRNVQRMHMLAYTVAVPVRLTFDYSINLKDLGILRPKSGKFLLRYESFPYFTDEVIL